MFYSKILKVNLQLWLWISVIILRVNPFMLLFIMLFNLLFLKWLVITLITIIFHSFMASLNMMITFTCLVAYFMYVFSSASSNCHLERNLKVFGHSLHGYSFSPVCFIRCLFKLISNDFFWTLITWICFLHYTYSQVFIKLVFIWESL